MTTDIGTSMTTDFDTHTDISMVTPSLTPDSDGITETDRAGDISGEQDLFIDTFTTEDTNSNTKATDETGAATASTTFVSDDDSTTATTDGYMVTVTTLEPGKSLMEKGSSSNMSSCSSNVCRNGGTCLTSIDGFQCHCR